MPSRLRHVPRPERTAAAVSLAVGVGLLGIKFLAYALTGSAAVFSDALESIVNVMASGFAAWALVLAHQPADEDHPYGHGKAEFLSAAFEGGMILLAALVILAKAADTLVAGADVERIGRGAILVAVAGLVNGGVGGFLIRVGRRQGSMTLEADGRHLLTDAVTSAAVLAALLGVGLTGRAWIDPAVAAAVALYIGWTGLRLISPAAAGLMDRQDAADEALLRSLLDAHVGAAGASPAVCSYHKLRHRHAGRFHWVDFHVRVPAHWDVARGHQVASLLEREMERALGEGNATAHIEPCREASCAVCGDAGREGERPTSNVQRPTSK